MDYCSACRRHLNGALVCPGCGAYAPDIAPPTTVSDSAPTWDMTSATVPETDSQLSGSVGPGLDTSARTSAEVKAVQPTGTGRAARRRQLARWKKSKRRAAVATAVAIVGGGLSVTMLDRQSTDRAQAASAPDEQSMGVVEEQVPEPAQSAPASPAVDRTSRRAGAEAETRDASAVPQQSQAASASAEPPLARPALAAAPDDRPAAAVPPRPVEVPPPAPQTTTYSPTDPAHDSSGTATQPSAAPPTADGTDADTSQPGTAPRPASPSEVCLLVLCLG
ncbi:hypothetical protein ACIG0D_22340 [Streptomyces sp. NPDC052773]|uniref:SCO2400 family protein n=1 Tax=Streptomyces sp. NPDC052773 TaxID=3365693 RepID=UPI0037CE2432